MGTGSQRKEMPEVCKILSGHTVITIVMLLFFCFISEKPRVQGGEVCAWLSYSQACVTAKEALAQTEG